MIPALARGGIPRPVNPKAVPRARRQRRQMRVEHIAVACSERHTMLGSRVIKEAEISAAGTRTPQGNCRAPHPVGCHTQGVPCE